ncbi:MAG TPA: hypothetical protein VNR89_00060 [Roseomonas sp.]|nr:hypothetical protein [Roseomonas sp.]
MPRLQRHVLALGLLMGLASPAQAQLRPDFDGYGRYLGQSERQGGGTHYYDPWGGYEGRSERSAGGNVRRYYDREGRYLGREDIERDFRRRRGGAGDSSSQGSGVQVYVDPTPFLQEQPPDPAARPDFQRGRTPWFGGR